jgi:hypothetical protein
MRTAVLLVPFALSCLVAGAQTIGRWSSRRATDGVAYEDAALPAGLYVRTSRARRAARLL